MDKAIVKVAFTDKENMTDVYYVGDVFEGSEERINELIASGHVEMQAARRRRKATTAKE